MKYLYITPIKIGIPIKRIINPNPDTLSTKRIGRYGSSNTLHKYIKLQDNIEAEAAQDAELITYSRMLPLSQNNRLDLRNDMTRR
jgi:hypothetical protein